MRPLRTIVALTLLLPTTVLLGASPAAAISDTCTFDRATATVTGLGGAVGFTYRISRQTGTSFLVFTDSGGTDYCYDGLTRKATVRNTDTIEFFGTNSNEEFVIDLQGGPLGPGKTAEGAGASEIEIEIEMYLGSDRLYVSGSAGDDTVTFRRPGDVRLNGDGDDDASLSGVDHRWAYGMGGDDAIAIQHAAPVVVYAGDGNDDLTGSSGPDTLSGEEGNDTIVGGEGADSLYGGPGADDLRGGDQDDYLVPGTGNDTASGGADDDTMYAEAGADGVDTYLGGPGDEDFVGYSDRTSRVVLDLDGQADDGSPGEGDRIGTDVESLASGSGNDRLTGSEAENSFYANGGHDEIAGGDGDDYLNGYDGDDSITGGPGDDSIYGGNGSDTLEGSAGDDSLVGNAGEDEHDGGVGNDLMYADNVADGSDVYRGGDGTDGISYGARSSAVTVGIDDVATDGGPGENDDVRHDVENVSGGSAADTITGSSAANYLEGGGGADVVSGAGGDDTLYGGDGADTINGNEGSDYASSGADNDTINIADADDDQAVCGTGTDTVNEDAYDTVAGDCEF